MPNATRPCFLLVDDDPTTEFFVKRALRKADVDADLVYANGVQRALEVLRKRECTPEAVLLDIQMPGRNGFDFLDELQRESDLVDADTKVVMLTSSNNPDDRRRALGYPYVRDYFEKHLRPSDIPSLLAA